MVEMVETFAYAWTGKGTVAKFTVEICWGYLYHECRVLPATSEYKLKLPRQLSRQVAEFAYENVKRITEHAIVRHIVRSTPTGHIYTSIDKREQLMRQLFTIEIEVDFRDKDKLPLFAEVARLAGCHAYAQAGLLTEQAKDPKPKVVVYAHDFYKGHTDIPLFSDAVAQGIVSIDDAAVANSLPAPVTAKPELTNRSPAGAEEPTGFSHELMAALKGLAR